MYSSYLHIRTHFHSHNYVFSSHHIRLTTSFLFHGSCDISPSSLSCLSNTENPSHLILFQSPLMYYNTMANILFALFRLAYCNQVEKSRARDPLQRLSADPSRHKKEIHKSRYKTDPCQSYSDRGFFFVVLVSVLADGETKTTNLWQK